jgi:hypothetical protein
MSDNEINDLVVGVAFRLVLLWPYIPCVGALGALAFFPDGNRGVLAWGIFATTNYFLAGAWFLWLSSALTRVRQFG